MAKTLYKSLASSSKTLEGKVTTDDLLYTLATTGIDAKTDSRLRSVIASLPTPPQVLKPIDLEVVAAQTNMMSALQGTLAIPSREDFVKVCEDSFDTALKVKSGQWQHTSLFCKGRSWKFGVSVCSVDGVRWSRVDAKKSLECSRV